jgi:hypothetical protein
MPRIAFATAVACFCLLAPEARAQQYSDAVFCRLSQEIADKANKDAGSRVDAITINIGMAVLCEMQIVDFKKRIKVSFSAFKAGWQARQQAQWNQIYCQPGSAFRQAIDAGWTISTTITDVDGERHYMEAKCSS